MHEIIVKDKHSSLFARASTEKEKTFLAVLHSKGRLLASHTNIRLGWRLQVVANTLAYCGTESVTSVKMFKVQTPECVKKATTLSQFKTVINNGI